MRVLKEDLRYKRVSRRCKNADKEVEAWTEELMTLHASRSIRSLNTTALLNTAKHSSIDTDLDNQVVRSRAVEIKMRALRAELEVTEQVTKLRKYLMAQYARVLKQEYKTITERKLVVDNVLGNLNTVIRHLSGVGQIADLLIEDCTSAGFTLKRVNEALAIRSVDR